MTESNNSNRVSCKRRQPNRLFQELLESLYREAVQNHNSLVPSLKEAISSLEKYPLPLASGAECAILKGFDRRLCRYIDSQLNGQFKNKKIKVCNNEHPSGGKAGKLKHSPTEIPEKIPKSNMTSTCKKNQTKTKNLETNLEKCPFQSKFGELSVKNTGSGETASGDTGSGVTIPSIGLSDCTAKAGENKSSKSQSEKNNNGGKKLPVASMEKALTVYFETQTDSDVVNEESENDLETIDLSLCENWESLTNNQPAHKYETNIRSLSQPIELLDPSEDEDSVTQVNLTSDDESIGQASDQCLHDDESPACKQCESISTAADAFELYFKEKTKRDAEEIGKYVLPRKMYKPAYKSGAYAILVALLEQRNECPYRDCLTKEELIQKAQKHADQSFTTPKPETNYTAWTNAKRLINKGMIRIWNFENQNEDFYTLTAMGRAVAMELVNENTPAVTVNDVIFHGQRNDRVPSLEDVVLIPPPQASVDEEQSSIFIEMPPGTFDIVMLIDKRENFKKTLPASPNNYCKYEERSLTIGDFLWIARSKKTGQELVLPYILERKRMDDLASSIKDGRFHEQKFRLRKCGLNNVIYLVESYKKNGQYALPMATLMQAVVNTSVLEEFNVVKTDSLDDTFRFLGMLSENLAHQFLPIFLRGSNRDTQGKELMTFEFFNKFSCKNKALTVRDTFIKMLLQLKGLSIEKALAITHKYTTPRNLMNAYDKCTPKEGELLLSNLKINYFSRNVGPVVSKTVYKLFSTQM